MNLDDLLRKTLRQWAHARSIIQPFPMLLSEIISLYEGWRYTDIIAQSESILHSLDAWQVFLLTKSVIHLSGEDDPRVKEYLFLALCLEKDLTFRGSFSIEISLEKDIDSLQWIMDAYDGFMEHIIPKWSIDHVIERYERHLSTLTEKLTNKDVFLIFLYYCLELYDIEHREYPTIKWLLNHFYKQHD